MGSCLSKKTTNYRLLQNLDTLFLPVNALASPLTRELGYLKSLKSMDLSDNIFTGEIPESFSELKLIGSLVPNMCSGNFLFDPILESDVWRNGASELDSPFLVRLFAWVFDLREGAPVEEPNQILKLFILDP